ncbi:MAG TPA: hypothetical protein PKY59_01865 [Pyrinomonadaceae bacterium]|nr:hypothetical protein [Pyrinomonadaceae bacterium]
MNAMNNLTKKSNGASVTSLVFGILGLITPIPAILFYVILTWNTRDDGWLAVFVIVISLAWWTLMTVLNLIFLVAAFVRKETGNRKFLRQFQRRFLRRSFWERSVL